jgi:hypothetical protein
VACSAGPDSVTLYDVSSNTLNKVASWSAGTTDKMRGIRFYPSQPTYALNT